MRREIGNVESRRTSANVFDGSYIRKAGKGEVRDNDGANCVTPNLIEGMNFQSENVGEDRRAEVGAF